jgi:hypothetical protein
MTDNSARGGRRHIVRTLVSHKWAVGVAAVALVLMLGTVSWAATQGAESDADTDTAAPAAAGPGMFGFGADDADDDTGPGRMRGRGMRGRALTDEMKAQIEERRAENEKRRDAFLDLVREKMSAEDQASLDSLLKTQDTQRAELEAARDALRQTGEAIHDLIGEYFPADSDTDSNTN